jgi:hypothetical protein
MFTNKQDRDIKKSQKDISGSYKIGFGCHYSSPSKCRSLVQRPLIFTCVHKLETVDTYNQYHNCQSGIQIKNQLVLEIRCWQGIFVPKHFVTGSTKSFVITSILKF